MTTTPTTFTIDCETCPVRGRMCGDCFVPVLGRAWPAQGQRRRWMTLILIWSGPSRID